MKNIFKVGAILFLSILRSEWNCHAGSKTGTSSVPFLTMGAGARSMAMGDASTAAAMDATALYWNPGLLPTIQGQSATFMHVSSVESSFYDYAAYVRNLDAWAWGTSFQYFSAGSVSITNSSGDKTGSLTPSDMALTGGIARDLNGYGLGLAAKYIQSTLEKTARTIAADGGVSSPWYLNNKLRAGLSVSNFGGAIKYDQESSNLPLVWRGGIEGKPWKGWTGIMDISGPRGEDLQIGLGGEYSLNVLNALNLSIRGGYNTTANGNGFDRFSAGMGFGWSALSADYAFVSHEDLDPSQILSLSYEF